MVQHLQRLLLHRTLTSSAEEMPPTFQPHEEAFSVMASASKFSPLVSGKVEAQIQKFNKFWLFPLLQRLKIKKDCH